MANGLILTWVVSVDLVDLVELVTACTANNGSLLPLPLSVVLSSLVLTSFKTSRLTRSLLTFYKT